MLKTVFCLNETTPPQNDTTDSGPLQCTLYSMCSQHIRGRHIDHIFFQRLYYIRTAVLRFNIKHPSSAICQKIQISAQKPSLSRLEQRQRYTFMSVRVFVYIYLVLKLDTVQTVASAQTMTSLVFMRRFRSVLGQCTLSLIV